MQYLQAQRRLRSSNQKELIIGMSDMSDQLPLGPGAASTVQGWAI